MVNGSCWHGVLRICRRAIFARPVDSAKLYPRTALILLTALNLLNYVDRSVLFAVQPLVQSEFRSEQHAGRLSHQRLPMVSTWSRRRSWGRWPTAIRARGSLSGGAIFWSGLTLLTAVTHTYTELLIRHTLVGIGEATFVTIAPRLSRTCFRKRSAGAFSVFSIWRFPWARRRDICWEDISVRIMAGGFPFILLRRRGFCWHCGAVLARAGTGAV